MEKRINLINQIGFSTDWLNQIVEFCCPEKVKAFEIKYVVAGDSPSGTARPAKRVRRRSSSYDFAGCGLVANETVPISFPSAIVRLPEKCKYPYYFRNDAGGYLPVTWNNPEEALVYITAHELRHLWQVLVPKGQRVYGATGQFCEKDASAYGIQMLRKWRRL